jgi:ubiquinone/menaquinone biosynthesis C-methylase UbiE
VCRIGRWRDAIGTMWRFGCSDRFGMTTYEDTAAFFDGTAGLYDDWFLKDVHYVQLAASIVERLRAHGPNRIIELGCGTGNLSVLLGRHFPEAEITGVDISGDPAHDPKE